MKKNIKILILGAIFFLISYTGALSGVDKNLVAVILSVIILAIYNLIKGIKKGNIKLNTLNYITWMLIVTVLISTIYNYESIINYYKVLHLTTVILLVCQIKKVLINIDIGERIDVIIKSLMVTGIGIYPLILTNVNIYQKNNSGVTIIPIGIAFIVYMLNALNKSYKSSIVGFLGVCVTLITVAVTSSRTALLILITCTILGIFMSKKETLIKKVKFMGKGVTVICIGMFVLLTKYKEIFEGISNKFQNSIQQNRLLSGREVVWEYTFNHIELLGNGESFYTDFGYAHAHNTIIGMIGVYGIIATIIFLIYICFCLCNSYKNYTSKGELLIFHLLLNIAFIGTSFGEDLINHPKLLLLPVMYFIVNYITRDDSEKNKSYI